MKRNSKQLIMSFIFIAILIFGWRYPWIGYFIPLCMVLGISIGLARSRKWCDWYCPRGSFYDAVIKYISPKKSIPAIFRKMVFRLGVLGVLMTVMIINLIRLWPNLSGIGLFFMILLTATTSLGVILAIFFHQRSWCAICPIGTLINLTSRRRS